MGRERWGRRERWERSGQARRRGGSRGRRRLGCILRRQSRRPTGGSTRRPTGGQGCTALAQGNVRSWLEALDGGSGRGADADCRDNEIGDSLDIADGEYGARPCLDRIVGGDGDYIIILLGKARARQTVAAARFDLRDRLGLIAFNNDQVGRP